MEEYDLLLTQGKNIIKKVDVSKILVNTKYRIDINENDRGIWITDVVKASEEIIELINKK